MSNKSNERQKNRRKRKRNERLEKIKMEKLYEKALLDPQTLEGQIRIDADRLIDNPIKPVEKKTETWTDYFKSFYPFAMY